MNNRRKMNHGKKQSGIRTYKIKHKKLRLPKKKIRGKVNRRNRVVKVHSVSNVDFVISTSFATYRIPRSCSSFFVNASQQAIQNVEFYKGQSSWCEGGFEFRFYWYDLELLFGMEDFKKYEVTEVIDKDTK